MADSSPGRPTKFTPEVRRKILKAVATGVPRTIAATAAGVGASTLMLWLANGRASNGEFREFLEALKKAESRAVATRVRRIARAGSVGATETTTTTKTDADGKKTVTKVRKKLSPQWTADAWFLERRTDEFTGNRHEIRELKKRLDELAGILKTITREHTPPPPPPNERPADAGRDQTAPQVGGEARPDAI